MTFVANEAPTYTRAYSVGLALIIVAGLVMIATEIGRMRGNRKRERGGRDYRLQLPENKK